MRRDDPTVAHFEHVLLTKVRLHAAQAISPYVLRNARVYVDDITESAADQLIVALDSHVLGEQEDRTHVIVEEPVYPTWRHHLVASLPPDSYRRRFLERYWRLDGPLAKRVTHTVTATAYRFFPRNEMDYPKHLGSAIEFVTIDDYPATEDYPECT